MTNEPTSVQAPNTHTLAIVSLVLSVLGLIFFLPLVGPIGGIITGNIAKREIAARPDLYTGEGIAQAGVILGWIGVALMILGLLILIAGLLFFLPMRVITSGPVMETIIMVVPALP